MIPLPSSKGRQVPRGTQIPLFPSIPSGRRSTPQTAGKAPAARPLTMAEKAASQEEYEPRIGEGGQIPLLMQAKDLRALPPWQGDKEEYEVAERGDRIDPGDPSKGYHEKFVTVTESDNELWERKLDESYDSPLYDSIEEEGVHRPVHVHVDPYGYLTHAQGHHRTAAAAAINPEQFVPVLHSDDSGEAVRGQELDGGMSGPDSWTHPE